MEIFEPYIFPYHKICQLFEKYLPTDLKSKIRRPPCGINST